MVTAAHAADEPAGRALLALADEHARPGLPSYAQAPALKQRLAGIEGAAPIIERGLSAYRADHEAGVNTLHRLLERQHYRLADWRLAVSGINYRRFFDINELAGLRVEDARTFRDMHELVARLIAADQLQGLRLDHIDGLLDPMQYTRRLQQLIRSVRGGERRKSFYVVVEKILAEGEAMPAFPGVAGTTGYEWLNTISRVLVDQAGRERLDALWREIDPAHADFGAVLENAKLRVLDTIMASEFNVLVQLLSRIAAGHFSTRDYSTDRLREALRLYVLEFPLYRTYVTAAGCTDNDRAVIEPHHRCRAPALAGHRRRHLQIPSRRADARSDSQRPALQPAAGAQVRAEDAAVHRADGGEVAGGHRALSLSRAARIERGRRRSDLAGTIGERISRPHGAAGQSNHRMA